MVIGDVCRIAYKITDEIKHGASFSQTAHASGSFFVIRNPTPKVRRRDILSEVGYHNFRAAKVSLKDYREQNTTGTDRNVWASTATTAGF